MNNLVNDPAFSALKERLRTEMFAKMEKNHDMFRSNSYYRDHWIENRIIKDVLIP